jgi:hypothetical protein
VERFREFDPSQPLSMSPVLDDWLPEGHLARFVADLVDAVLDLGPVYDSYTETELFTALDAAATGAAVDVAAVWAAIERVAPRAQIAGALATVEELVPDDDGSAEAAMRVVLAERYRTVRPFLGLLAESVSLSAASGGAAVLAAAPRCWRR